MASLIEMLNLPHDNIYNIVWIQSYNLVGDIMNRNCDVITFTYILKIVITMTKTTYKKSIRLNRITICFVKWNFYRYFPM